MANIKGGSKNDVLAGTAAADRLQGMAGNDRLFGLGGNDTLEGGLGDDVLQGGAGSDQIDGGAGIDTADYSDRTGGLQVFPENWTQNASGNFTVREYNAAGNLVATDTLSGMENITGGSGNDQIHGDHTANVLSGGAGDDLISGGSGNDSLYGGAGNDLLDAVWDKDFVDGGDGIDTYFSQNGIGLAATIDLAVGTGMWGDYPEFTDTIVNVENARGADRDDTIRGNDGANILYGIMGADLLDGRGGDDWLVGDYVGDISGFADNLSGGDGADWLQGGAGNDLLTGGQGVDRFLFGNHNGSDMVTDFEDGVDQVALYDGLAITGWSSADVNSDGLTDSVASLSDGGSIAFLGQAAVPASLANGSAVMSLGEPLPEPIVAVRPEVPFVASSMESQSLLGSIGMEKVMGKPTSGMITIKGTRNADDIAVVAEGVAVNGTLKAFSNPQIDAGFILNGDAGNDRITGGRGPDELAGGSGNDRLDGAAGADKLSGGDGNDWLSGTMEDRFDGGRGTDTLDLSGSPMAVGVDIFGTGTFFPDLYIAAGSNGYLNVWLGESELSDIAKGIENIIGSSYNDWLIGNGLENFIRGGAGDDVIGATHADGRVDRLFGEAGNDELGAGSGNDELTGGSGADKFVFDPDNSDGNWVIHDYSKAEGDEVVLFPYSGNFTWKTVDYLGTPSVQATFGDGDTLTFVGVTDYSQIDIVATMSWPVM